MPSCAAGIAGQRFTPLRSAEPHPATDAQRAELALTAGQNFPELAQWIKDLTAQHRAVADRLANHQSLMVPAEDPDYGDLGQAFPSWTGSSKGAISAAAQAGNPPSARVLERVLDRDAEMEAGD